MFIKKEIFLVNHYQYTGWIDCGVPESSNGIISLLNAINSKHKFSDWPILVHCSAGVGRTGTLIALDILMEQARCKKMVDVMNTVVKLRNERCRMVQAEVRFYLLY